MIYYGSPRQRLWHNKAAAFTVIITSMIFVAIGIFFAARDDQAHKKAKSHLNSRSAFFDRGDYRNAAAQSRLAVQLDGDYPRAHNCLGYDLFKLGNVKEGMAECRKAIHLNSQYLSPHDNLGYMLYETGDLVGARKEFDAALRLDSQEPDATAEIGRILASQGDLDGALKYGKNAVNIAPNDAVTHRCLGYILYKRGDKAGAKAECDKCIAIGNLDEQDQARAYLRQYGL